MPDAARRLSIGEVAERTAMASSRIRYYETVGLIDPPERRSGKRRYTPLVLRRLAIIDAAQRVGFSLEEIRDLVGSRHGPAHERLRRLALQKLPEIDGLIVRATTVRQLLQFCGECRCQSIDECLLLEERTRLLDHRALQPIPRQTADRVRQTHPR
jgi:MerR family redox-sensitive transcriptional activator SoxR